MEDTKIIKPKKKYKVSEAVKHRQRKVLTILAQNGGIMPMGKAMQQAGYSKTVSLTPSKVTNSRSWQELMEEQLPDSLLSATHNELLKSKSLDKMSFPNEHDDDDSDDKSEDKGVDSGDSGDNLQEDNLTDGDIRELLKDVGCTVRRIVHGKNNREVYFWSSNDKARNDALQMAYKLKGRFDEKVNIDITRKEIVSIKITEITSEAIRDAVNAPIHVDNKVIEP